MNGLDLFSGIGGLSLALEPWVQVIAYCEQDRYAQGVLLSRMRSCELDAAPIWDDVRTLHAGHFGEPIDIISGGFPCQDISAAGRGAGLAGERSGLFFEIVRLVEEVRPAFVFLENVPAIRTRGLKDVVGSFADLRYDCRWTCVSAASVGAPHLRKRWFLLAADAERGERRFQSRRGSGAEGQGSSISRDDGAQESLADANSFGSRKRAVIDKDRGSIIGNTLGPGWWSTEPNVGRVAHGIHSRVDRLRCLGNACIPLQARVAFKRLAGLGG